MQTWNDILGITKSGNATPPRRVERTEAEWRAQLSPEQFHVTRQHGTERAFSSEMCSLFEPGKYACICCGTVLFDSAEKFEYHADRSFGMIRVETLCNVCDAHLGHVFPDGPAPSGLRYCMNAVALEKVGATAEAT